MTFIYFAVVVSLSAAGLNSFGLYGLTTVIDDASMEVLENPAMLKGLPGGRYYCVLSGTTMSRFQYDHFNKGAYGIQLFPGSEDETGIYIPLTFIIANSRAQNRSGWAFTYIPKDFKTYSAASSVVHNTKYSVLHESRGHDFRINFGSGFRLWDWLYGGIGCIGIYGYQEKYDEQSVFSGQTVSRRTDTYTLNKIQAMLSAHLFYVDPAELFEAGFSYYTGNYNYNFLRYTVYNEVSVNNTISAMEELKAMTSFGNHEEGEFDIGASYSIARIIRIAAQIDIFSAKKYRERNITYDGSAFIHSFTVIPVALHYNAMGGISYINNDLTLNVSYAVESSRTPKPDIEKKQTALVQSTSTVSFGVVKNIGLYSFAGACAIRTADIEYWQTGYDEKKQMENYDAYPGDGKAFQLTIGIQRTLTL